MSVGCEALEKVSMVAGCLFLALQVSLAQNAGPKPAAGSVAATRNLLVEKAHALESRGRPDMAIQLWQQILLSDPNNVESLAGMARDLKLTGSDKAIDALDRLRKVSPNNPDIPRIEALPSTRAESAELRQAGDLAKQGKPEDAMSLYKQLYGDRPPDGDIALAYYETLYGTAKGKPEAITAMRALAGRNPGDPRFVVELGIMLTYEQRTRGEGIRILEEHPKDLNAQAALRQALVWDSANPASAAELRDYLRDHPQDTELAARLKENETKLAQMNSGIARTPAERAAKLQIAAGGQPGVELQLQLAGTYLLRSDAAHACDIYQQVLKSNPESAAAWKGLIAALRATNRNTEALQQISLIPAAVRKELDADIEFVQTEAGLYAAAGDIARAAEFMNRVQAHYAKLHTEPPATVEIQNAWLLFNTGNDRALYPQLMKLGGRAGLTSTQRETVQDIWADWSVRRAAAAMDNGNTQRSVDILDAASQAFPDNLAVRKAMAGGYVQAGRTKESLALYKTIPMQDATAGDFQGAVDAALAANDMNQAQVWLSQALERFPHDPAVLSLAARYEQARGDNQRAAEFYRASLAAMPSTSPAEKLAHVLVYPDQNTKAHRAVTAADLQRLLDPDNEPFARTTAIPSLPANGRDPYNGAAPVVLTPAQPQTRTTPASQTLPRPDAPKIFPPSASQGQTPSAPVYVPQSWARPRQRIASRQLRRAQA
jgi:tetratricopeptide (TPR) repeat protein